MSSDPEIITLCGIYEDGTKILQVINLKREPVKISVKGFDSKSIDLISTTELNNWEIRKNITVSQK